MSSIPKKIHYCWFGKNNKSNLFKKCVKSWKKYLPDYEIIEWNEENFDIESNLYVKQAYEEKKYAFVSDYVRLYALLNYGGIYMDTDVEILRPLDRFLDNTCFVGFESDVLCGTSIIGARKGNRIIRQFLESYNNRMFIDKDGLVDETPNTDLLTKICIENGLKFNDSIQNLGDITIYPKTFFSPLGYEEEEVNFSQDTYTIHHFEGSWLNEEKRLDSMIRRKYNRRKNFLSKYINKKSVDYILNFKAVLRYKVGTIYRFIRFYFDKIFNKEIVSITLEEAYKNISLVYEKPEGFCDCSNLIKDGIIDLSIIVPAYNVESYIEECINSLINQKTKYDFEIIVINDGSTDRTLEIIDKYRSKLKIISQDNSGLSASRNIGIDKAIGRYIMFVDSDDYIEENSVETLLNKAYEVDADIVLGRYRIFNKLNSKESKLFNQEEFKSNNINNLPGIACSKILKKSLFENIRYWFEDTIVHGLLYRVSNRIVCINDIVYNYRINTLGITATAPKSIKSIDTYFIIEDIINIQKKIGLDIDEKLYYFLLYHLGLINYNRLKVFGDEICKNIFVLSCNIIEQSKLENINNNDFPKGLRYIEEAFLSKNYSLLKNTIGMIESERLEIN